MRHSIGLLIAALLMASTASAGQTEERDPVRDPEGQSIETLPGNPDAETIEQARENYREILDLASNDPALHVEVLRRLGDLELDAAEASQLDANAETLDLSGFDNAVEHNSISLEESSNDRKDTTLKFSVTYGKVSVKEILFSTIYEKKTV